MSVLIGLIPAFAWGLGPIIASLVGGKAIHQLLGMAYGQAIIGIVLYLIFHPPISISAFLWVFFGGALWAIAQLTQFKSFQLMDVSASMPISTGLQLIEIPLIGVIVWNEWGTTPTKIAGFISIIVLILGITMTNFNENSSNKSKSDQKKGILILFFGTFGFVACSVFPRIPNTTGLTNVFPQLMGMLSGAIILSLFIRLKDKKPVFFQRYTLKNIFNGIIGGIGEFAYLVSLNLNGVATAFPLTQLNVVVSSIGGIMILHEHKSRKELILTILGLVLIVISAFVISHLK